MPRSKWHSAKLVRTPMSPAARARLEERDRVYSWQIAWGRMWARIGVECMRPVARRFLATPFMSNGARPHADGLHVAPHITIGDCMGVALIDYKLRFPQARGDRSIVSQHTGCRAPEGKL